MRKKWRLSVENTTPRDLLATGRHKKKNPHLVERLKQTVHTAHPKSKTQPINKDSLKNKRHHHHRHYFLRHPLPNPKYHSAKKMHFASTFSQGASRRDQWLEINKHSHLNMFFCLFKGKRKEIHSMAREKRKRD